ncbi:hypothetical protein Tco_1442207 [Tanacetum coccineum]
MSTMSAHQQSLTEAGSETRPPMLERCSYIPWASIFKRYLNQKRERRKFLNHLIDEGPYKFKKIQPKLDKPERDQTKDDLTGDDLKKYEADIEAMNLIFISIPNDIYNSGTELNAIDKEIRFNNEFDQFTTEADKSLMSVFNQFSHLVNDLKRNDIQLLNVTINSKFLNCLQPKCYKYVTNVCLAKNVKDEQYDVLFDYLQQYENLSLLPEEKRLQRHMILLL